MADPITRIAQQRIVKLSADLEVQIGDMQGSAVAIEIFRRLRERAAESLAALILINFDDPAEIPKAKFLQNEVKRYDEWFGAMRDIVAEGKAFDKSMSAEEREEMLDMLMEQEGGERIAAAIGLIEDVPQDA